MNTLAYFVRQLKAAEATLVAHWVSHLNNISG